MAVKTKKKLILILATIIAFCSVFIPQTKTSAGPPWYIGGREVPGPLPPNTWQIPPLDMRLNFVYGRANGYDLLMDFAKPRLCGSQKVPVVVFIHGGWWIAGSKSIWGAVHNMCYQLGFAVASMNYRLSGIADHPELVNDCKLAVRYLRANAEQFGIDPNRIAIWGASAGGHLAALCNNAGDKDGMEGPGYENYSSRPNASVNWCGITDLTQPWSPTARTMFNYFLGCDPYSCVDKAKNASPVWQASSDDPPLLTIHGDADPVVAYSQAESLANAMHNAKNKGAFLRVLNGNHGLVGTSPSYTRVNWVTFAHMARYIEPGLLCDLNVDGKVDMTDANELLSLMGLVGYPPNHQGADVRWNPLADIIPDGKINYKDWQSFCTALNPPIAIQKSLNGKSGRNYTFQITLQNNGPLTLHDLTLADTYPKELVFVSGPPNAVYGRNTVEIPIESLPAHSTIQFNLVFALGESTQTDTGKTLANVATVSGDEIIAVKSSASIDLPGLEMRKSASKMRIAPGESVNFSITVKNTGNLPLTGIEIADNFPKEIEFISSRPQGENSPGIVKFSIVKLNPGEAASFLLSFRASKSHNFNDNKTIANFAFVSCNELFTKQDSASIVIQKEPPTSPLELNIAWKGVDTKSGKMSTQDVLELEVAPDGGSAPYDISIDWGDGNKSSNRVDYNSKSTLTHKFLNKGIYSIIIKCVDSFGRSVVKSRKISVE